MRLRRRIEPGSPRDFFAVPRGDVNRPVAGSEVPGEVVQIFGWALFPAGVVARVDVAVDGGPPQRARLGMPRRDVPAQCDHPSAPIAGFEYMAQVGSTTGSVEVRATAYSADGRSVELEPVRFTVRPRERHEPGERDALLRERAARFARPRLADADGRTRVVVFSHQLPYGGASLYLVELLRRLLRKPGFECTVVTYQDGPLREDLEALGMPVHVTDPFPVTTLGRYEGSVAELMAWMATQRFDVALVNTLGSFQGADAAERLGLPVVWGVHESFALPLFWSTAYVPGALHPYVRARAEHAFANAAAVLFEAEATRRLFLGDAAADRLITVPYGIELDAVRAARASYARADVRDALGIDRDTRLVLCLGTVEPRKSQAMLAEAFGEIAPRHPDAVLALVGRTEAEWCADYVWGVSELIRRRGLGRRIRLEPVAANPYPWHVAADLHVCASDVESLPRSLLESMAFGVPVVSTRVYGVPEVVEDGVTGYLCDMRDGADLARALSRALSTDASERDRIAATASARVFERHEPHAYADRVWDLLQALARDAGADPHTALFGEPARSRLGG